MQGICVAGPEELQRLGNVALGNEKADLAILNGDLVNVYTRELQRGYSVAIKGKLIAYVGTYAAHAIGAETKVIDATGKVLIPGLIDAHAHLIWLHSLDEFLRYGMRGGTTTIITDLLELAFPLGCQGIVEFLESAKAQPIKIFATIPPMRTMSPRTERRAMDVETLWKLLAREDVMGLGELYWSNATHDPERIFKLFAETLASGKKLEGHAAGGKGNRLMAYIAPGISSCNETTTVEETLERLRRVYIQTNPF